MFSKSMASPLTAMACRGPSAGRPSALRWNHTLKKAKKRCQATPIVGCAATVINQARDTVILMNATMAMPVSSVESGVCANHDPIHAVKGKCTAVAHDSPLEEPSAYSIARKAMTQTPTRRIVIST